MLKRSNSMSRRAALCLMGGALVLPRTGLASGVETLSGRAFGTHWQIASPQVDKVSRLAPTIDRLFAQIDRQFSPWRHDSVISRFNAGPAGEHRVDRAVCKVTTVALEIAARSAGAYDPTVGPIVARWGFGPIEGGAATDWRALTAGEDTLEKTRSDVTLDLCGIAKGWALDQAAALARDAGIDDFLFDLGGEFLAMGQHPDARNWQIAVEAPISANAAPAVLRLPAGVAVATSGMVAQSYSLNGRLYSHIINPETRAPVAGVLRSVTVLAPDAMTADGWATALFAAGDIAGPELAVAQGIAALFVFEGNNALEQVRTGPISDFIL